MNNQFKYKVSEEIFAEIHNNSKKGAIILFDLDGVIAKIPNENMGIKYGIKSGLYSQGELDESGFDWYYDRMCKAETTEVLDYMRYFRLMDPSLDFRIVTARPKIRRNQTISWLCVKGIYGDLVEHVYFKDDRLDNSAAYKKEIVSECNYERPVIGFIDDNIDNLNRVSEVIDLKYCYLYLNWR